MRIAFVGGQGSGKSTCAAVFARFLAARGLPVLAVDAAPDRRLAGLLGRPTPPCWSAAHLPQPAAPSQVLAVVGSASAHPGGVQPDGPRPVVVLSPDGLGPVEGPPTCPSVPAADGVRLVATDAHDLLLDHLADGAGEYVVVDLAADRSAASRYDLTVLAREPTRRAFGLYRQHAEHAAAQGAVLRVLGNKTSDGGDAGWLTERMGDLLVGCIGHSAWIRAAERGTAGSVSGLEPDNTAALAAVRAGLDGRRPPEMQQGGPMSGHPAEVERAYSASRR